MKIISELAAKLFGQSTKRNHGEELSNGSPNGQSQNKENYFDELTANDEIAHTPFRLVGNKEQGYCLALGQYLLTVRKPKKQDVLDDLDSRPWHIITNMMIIMPEILKTLQDMEANKPKNI